MYNIENRFCFKTKDVINISGYSERLARKIINDIKVFYKKKHQPVTIYDFADFMDIPVEKIKPYIV